MAASGAPVQPSCDVFRRPRPPHRLAGSLRARPQGGPRFAHAWSGALRVLPCLLIVFTPGCYVLKEGWHHVSVLRGTRSIDKLLRREDLDAGLRQALERSQRIRRFAEGLGLGPSRSFSTFYDNDNGPVGYMVSACPPLEFEPYTWRFPIVGRVPYKGFHRLEDALWERDRLASKGYETVLQEIDAYSTLGWLTDPLYASLLRGGPGDLAEVIIHEMTHEAVFIEGNVELSENLASYIGKAGARRFLLEEFGPGNRWLQAYETELADRSRLRDFMREAHRELGEIYGSDRTATEKRRERERAWVRLRDRYRRLDFADRRYRGFFDRQPNNAWLLAHYRYHGREQVLDGLLSSFGGDLVELVRFARSLEDAEDPEALIRSRVAAGEGPCAP